MCLRAYSWELGLAKALASLNRSEALMNSCDPTDLEAAWFRRAEVIQALRKRFPDGEVESKVARKVLARHDG